MNGPERDDGADETRSRSAGTSPDETRSSSEGTNPNDSPSSSDGTMAPTSSPTAVRNWTVLLSTLALVSFVSAVTTLVVHDAVLATVGATILGVGLAGAAIVSRTTAPRVLYALSAAWAEHRTYVWFATGLFAMGIAFGVALAAAGVDLTELFVEMILEELEGDEFAGGEPDPTGLDGGIELETSAEFFIINNTLPFLASILGALTFGIFTFFIMTFNGLVVGNISVAIGADVGYGQIVALLVPHGVFELPALFVAAGVGFRFLYRAGERILGKRDALFTKPYLGRTALLVLFAWLMLVVAAFVEAYLTIPIAEFFYPDQAS